MTSETIKVLRSIIRFYNQYVGANPSLFQTANDELNGFMICLLTLGYNSEFMYDRDEKIYKFTLIEIDGCKEMTYMV